MGDEIYVLCAAFVVVYLFFFLVGSERMRQTDQKNMQ